MKLQSILKFAPLAFLILLTACSTTTPTRPFDPKSCLDEEPLPVAGIEIIEGYRTEQNIIADMYPVWCNGMVLLKRMAEEGKPVCAGTVTFKVVAEYTGEIVTSEVIASDIPSEQFSGSVNGMIATADFSPWDRKDDVDTVFIYPMTFNQWWD